MGEANGLSEIAGRYQIQEKLGEGAFGTVCRAKDTVLGRMVAIKTVKIEGLAAAGTKLDELKERFRREAQVAAQLKHPNIVTIYDIGQDGGLSYIAMEYIEGRGLDEVIPQSGLLPLERVVAIGVQVAEALDYAHRQGVVHRDIKPANVMLETEDHVKVTDFGIAKPLDAIDHLTVTGSLLGTPAYMSPEQARGEALDGRSDLFSLGCVLYEMALGTRAFQGDNITSLLLKIVTEEPRPVREALPSLPEPFAQIVARALRKNREERYASGKDLAKDLTALGSIATISELETLGVSGTSALHVPAATAAAAAPPEPATAIGAATSTVASSGEPPKRRGPLALLIGAVAVLLLAVGAMLFLLLSPRGEPTPPEASAGAREPRSARAETARAATESHRRALEEAARARQIARDQIAQALPESRREAVEDVRDRFAELEELADFLDELPELADEEAEQGLVLAGEILGRVFSGEGRGEADSALTARAGLVVLVQAERGFRASEGRYATLEEIGEVLAVVKGDSELKVHGDHADAGGVRFELLLTAEGFRATATPLDDESVTFVTDQTGIIRTERAEG